MGNSLIKSGTDLGGAEGDGAGVRVGEARKGHGKVLEPALGGDGPRAAPRSRRRAAPDTPDPGVRAENLLPLCHFVKCLLPVVTLPLYLLIFIF